MRVLRTINWLSREAKTKGITNSDLKMLALFGLVDKVGIASVIQLNTIWELGYLTPLGGPRVCYTDLNIPWYSYTRVYEHRKHAHKYKYVQIILVLSHPHQQV